MKISKNARNAIFIGSLCSVSYLAVYFARNTLSAVSPHMLDDGFSEGFIGIASSLYFICYACGQLINGAIGNKVKARYMISLGLLLSGISNYVFMMLASSQTVAYIAYGISGFFLSMIYGPMTRVVSENTEPIHATRCCLGYTFASFIASPAAGLFATFLAWQGVFTVTASMLVVMAAVSFTFFLIFERKGIVSYGKFQPKERGVKGIGVLFKREIVRFSLISIITGVIRTSVVFWLPTYLVQRLNFSSDTASSLFAITTLIISFTAFIAVFVFERLKRNLHVTILIAFSLSTLFLIAVYFVTHPVINIICLTAAIMSSGMAATMLFSRYCPSLRDTGMVSGATGFLDFLSYMAAAFSNWLFPNAVAVVGWGGLILVWVGIVAFGVMVALPYKKIFRIKEDKGAEEQGSASID